MAASAAAAALPLAPRTSRGQQTNSPSATPSIDTTSSSAQARQQKALAIRVQAANQQAQQPLPNHTNNGDEDLYPNKIASYTKGLPHNNLGEVDLTAYQTYLNALASGAPADFEAIPLGCQGTEGYYKLVNPQGGIAFDLEGIDAAATFTPPPPAFGSAEINTEIVELYWRALLRDVPATEFDTNPQVQQAIADLNRLGDAYKGPKENGQVTTRTVFRFDFPGTMVGPLVSQFRYLPVTFGSDMISQQMMTSPPGQDFMTNYADWLNVQQGCPSTQPMTFDPTRRYLRTGRDAGTWVHMDTINEAFIIAVLILLYPFAGAESGREMAAPSPTNPYLQSKNQTGFATFGLPDSLTSVVEVTTRALKAAWFQKWYVHRRLRPEAYAGAIHNTLTGAANYPVGADQLNQSPALSQIHDKYGTYLLPQVFPEGSPLHPSYPQGHSTTAGACATILKAFFDESMVIPNPVVPNADGTAVVPYTGPDAGNLTVGGEINKLASNIASSRDWAGVHYRSDGLQGLLLGEAVAISILQDHRPTYNENFSGFTFHKFDGTQITI
jgi:membrane-associated phospholipid phosphatase